MLAQQIQGVKFAGRTEFAANLLTARLLLGVALLTVCMNGAVEILKREREAAAEEIRALRARLRDLDAAIGCLEGQAVTAKSGKSEGDLKPKVLAVLHDRLQAGCSPKQIAIVLTAGGRPTSDASVSSTLSRLKGEGKVRNQHGIWFAVANAESANEVVTRNLTESATRERAPDQQPSADADDVLPNWDDDLDADVPF